MASAVPKGVHDVDGGVPADDREVYIIATDHEPFENLELPATVAARVTRSVQTPLGDATKKQNARANRLP